jgi:hypothetical protein
MSIKNVPPWQSSFAMAVRLDSAWGTGIGQTMYAEDIELCVHNPSTSPGSQNGAPKACKIRALAVLVARRGQNALCAVHIAATKCRISFELSSDYSG